MICPVCGKGQLSSVDDILSTIEGLTFVERGHRCNAWVRSSLTRRTMTEPSGWLTRLGLWGEPLKLHRKLSNSGRGLVLRIPEDLRKSMGLKGSETVSLAKVGKTRVLLEVEQ